MLLVGDDGRYRDCNAAACAVLGRRREQVIGLRAEELIAPERLPLGPRWRRLVERGRLSGRTLLLGGDGTRVKANHLSVANVAPGLHLVVFVAVESEQDALDWLLEEPLAGVDGAGPAHSRITPREREVITLLALGLTGEEIARKLVISPETVRIHVRNARRRLGARTRAHAIALAIQSEQIEL
jgi:DNA-binding CsgD family transcriptional regulator